MTICRFKFPKFPIWKTLISSPNKSISEEERALYEQILKDVKDILDDEDLIEQIMKDFRKNDEAGKTYEENREICIKRMLKKAKLETEADFENYIKALKYSKVGLLNSFGERY